jgi:RHS repeat-associated protein
VTPAGTVHYHVDHLGSPRMISDESSPALRVAIHDYFPFGADTANITQDSRRLRFTGHERDLDGTGPGGTSLDYMHARYYTAAWARFLSVDSVSGNPGTPQTWNRYAYVADNPLNGIDPRGLSCQDVFYDGAVCWSDLVVLKGGITARKELDFAGIHFSAGPAISVDALTGDVSGSISTSGGPPSSEDGGRSGSFGVTVTAKNSENYDPKVTVTGSFAANGLGTSGSISSASRSINGSVGGVGPTVSTPSTSPNQPGAVDPASSGISMAVAGVGAKLTASEVSVSIPIDLYGTITIGFRPSGLFQALQDRYDATIEHFNQLVAAQQGH